MTDDEFIDEWIAGRRWIRCTNCETILDTEKDPKWSASFYTKSGYDGELTIDQVICKACEGEPDEEATTEEVEEGE